MKTNLTVVFAVMAVIFAPSLGRASTIAQETFEGYTLGLLNGQGGAGGGWSGPWGAPGAATRADVVSASMTYTVPGGGTFSGAANALEVQLLTGQTGNQITGARQLSSSLGETFYVGYMARVVTSTINGTNSEWAGGNNTFALHLGTNSSSTTTLNFGLRGGAVDEFMIRYATGTPVAGASTGGNLVNDTDYYLVAQVNWDSGLSAFTTARMWLNPTVSDNVDTPLGDAALDFADFANPITHLFWRQAALQNDDILRADNLILGTSWADVVPVPEPVSIALLGLGALAVVASRRRRC